MEPIFKVGDEVRVKNRIPNKSYKYSFTEGMAKLSGKVFVIEEVRPNWNSDSDFDIPDDCALYKLKGDNDSWSWSSGMLELVRGDTLSLKSKSKSKLKLNFKL